jgi:hypothetical protein
VDLSTLMTELSDDDRKLLVTLLNRASASASRDERPRAEQLASRVADAAGEAPPIQPYHARILLMLFVSPRGRDMLGISPSVLETLRERGRVTRDSEGRWHITRGGARRLYRTHWVDSEIDAGRQGHMTEALLAS